MFECDKIKNELANRKYIYDLVLLAVFIVIGLLLYLLLPSNKFDGQIRLQCGVEDDGWTRFLSFEDNGYYFLAIDNKGFVVLSNGTESLEKLKAAYSSDEYEDYNVFLIADGKIDVIEASCPDLICVNTKPASQIGDTICCLPHKLIITVVEDGRVGYDDMDNHSQYEDEGVDVVTW